MSRKTRVALLLFLRVLLTRSRPSWSRPPLGRGRVGGEPPLHSPSLRRTHGALRVSLPREAPRFGRVTESYFNIEIKIRIHRQYSAIRGPHLLFVDVEKIPYSAMSERGLHPLDDIAESRLVEIDGYIQFIGSRPGSMPGDSSPLPSALYECLGLSRGKEP